MNRDIALDFYRALGLICIFLAHAMPPAVIMQIRDFDVPLMVFVSGIVAPKAVDSLCNYYIHRTARLLVPTYLFLVFLFVLYYCCCHVGLIPLMDNFFKVVLNSFLLLEDNSIGFVWVVRVFILMMLVTPLLLKVKIEHRSNYLIIIGIFIISSIVFQVIHGRFSLPPVVDLVFVEYLQYLLGYGIVYIIALRYKYATKKERIITLALCVVILVVSLLYYYRTFGFPIEFYLFFKYPPLLPYLGYGLTICLLLMLCKDRLPKCIVSNRLLSFLGSNSFWLYLWHIPFALVVEIIPQWWLRWMVLIAAPLMIYGIQYYLVKKYITRGDFKKYLLG